MDNTPAPFASQDGSRDDLIVQGPIHQLYEAEQRRKSKHRAAWLGLFLLSLGSVFMVQYHGSPFTVSVLPTKEHPPFDGTVMPVEKVPDWVKLKPEEYKLSFEQIPSDKLIAAPVYDPSNLIRSADTLGWNAADSAIRDQKITYSVPYMGSYRLNGKEYDGSHLAVDIKTPMNTPLRSIANGVVVKVANLTSGFGKHVVIQHQNVPSFSDPSVKTMYYSSYSHMGQVLVNEGDIVLRGQPIGLSGESGFATTPHVHFQIDTGDAPWHPYWGFTYQEQAAAGLDFVGAINAGLGKDRATTYTINPLMYVQKYVTTAPTLASAVVSPVSTPPVSTPASDVTPTPIVTPPAPVVPSPVAPSPVPIPLHFAFQVKPTYKIGDSIFVKITVLDDHDQPASTLSESALVLLSGDTGVLSQSEIRTEHLSQGQVTIEVQTPKVSKGQMTVLYQGGSFKSDFFEVVNPVAVTPPPVVSSAPRPKLFADVSGGVPFYDALSYLKKKAVFGGYQDGTFKPDQQISRVEVLKVVLKASNRPLLPTSGSLSYVDVESDGWYVPYIATAQQNGIVQGYIGNHFKPHQSVTRSEFLKMLLIAFPIAIEPTVTEAPYSDVAVSDWFAVFAQFAKQKNLLPNVGDGTLRANEIVTRSEVAEIIYRLMLVVNSGASTYTAGLGGL